MIAMPLQMRILLRGGTEDIPEWSVTVENAVDWIKVVDTLTARKMLQTYSARFENLKGGAGVDILTGDTRANTQIYGLAGGDTLMGRR